MNYRNANLVLGLTFLIVSYIGLVDFVDSRDGYKKNDMNDMYKYNNITLIQEQDVITGRVFYINIDGYIINGIASYYTYPFHGRKTANGETFNTFDDMTVAHKTLPFDTNLIIRNKRNGKIAMARVNDRGPYVIGRIIDVSYKIAEELDMVDNGIDKVDVMVMK